MAGIQDRGVADLEADAVVNKKKRRRGDDRKYEQTRKRTRRPRAGFHGWDWLGALVVGH